MRKLSYIMVDGPDAFGSFEAFSDVLRHLKDLGYDGVELNLARPQSFETDTLARFTREIGLPVVSFMTGTHYFGEGLCLSSPDASIRRSAVERLQECTEIAARFGALLVVGQMQGFRTDEADPEFAKAQKGKKAAGPSKEEIRKRRKKERKNRRRARRK